MQGPISLQLINRVDHLTRLTHNEFTFNLCNAAYPNPTFIKP